ncbi:MAG: thioredoxin family protein [Theionarchaea archaeon]|nr:thioredoxin family protein [Theionarchaea archaeon]
MRIEIFGIERSKCKLMMKHVEDILEDLDMEAQLIYVSEPIDIHKRGVYLTPAFAVNGNIKIAGRVPSPDEIRALLPPY